MAGAASKESAGALQSIPQGGWSPRKASVSNRSQQEDSPARRTLHPPARSAHDSKIRAAILCGATAGVETSSPAVLERVVCELRAHVSSLSEALEAQTRRNATLAERSATLKDAHGDMLRQLREMKARADAAEAARDEAVSRTEAAARELRESSARTVMAREKLRINEHRVAGSAESLQRLQVTIRVMHAQLTQWGQETDQALVSVRGAERRLTRECMEATEASGALTDASRQVAVLGELVDSVNQRLLDETRARQAAAERVTMLEGELRAMRGRMTKLGDVGEVNRGGASHVVYADHILTIESLREELGSEKARNARLAAELKQAQTERAELLEQQRATVSQLRAAHFAQERHRAQEAALVHEVRNMQRRLGGLVPSAYHLSTLRRLPSTISAADSPPPGSPHDAPTAPALAALAESAPDDAPAADASGREMNDDGSAAPRLSCVESTLRALAGTTSLESAASAVDAGEARTNSAGEGPRSLQFWLRKVERLQRKLADTQASATVAAQLEGPHDEGAASQMTCLTTTLKAMSEFVELLQACPSSGVDARHRESFPSQPTLPSAFVAQG